MKNYFPVLTITLWFLLSSCSFNRVTSITLNPSKLILAVGSETSFQSSSDSPISIIVVPSNESSLVINWESSNPQVATVDSGGLIRALAAGTTIIKATASDGSNVSGKCDLTVYAMPEYIDPSVSDLAKKYMPGIYVDSAGHKINYRLYVPKNYKAGKIYPITLFLHGGGEMGSDNLSQLKNYGPGVLSDSSMVQNAHPSFIVCPQCPDSGQWGNYEGITWPGDDMVGLLNSLQTQYSIDASRIYITGLSLGGLGAYYIIARNPDYFAAAIPCCGGGELSKAGAIANTPIWACHSTADPAVPYSGKMPWITSDVVGSASLLLALISAGAKNCQLKTVQDGTHQDGWIQAYTDMNMINWLFSQSKQ